ncbi:hypothetical protein NCTGTJJY_CDS0089 [Serratia phage 92A1]|nr:hypothetical protein NCTGTJJY_CDS0089 [Serratia phage 92A1]
MPERFLNMEDKVKAGVGISQWCVEKPVDDISISLSQNLLVSKLERAVISYVIPLNLICIGMQYEQRDQRILKEQFTNCCYS